MAYNTAHMENAFEAGRFIQEKFRLGHIPEDIDSVDLFFHFGLRCAAAFEEEHSDTDDYYSDFDAFMEAEFKQYMEEITC